jgi:hypothetical protein
MEGIVNLVYIFFFPSFSQTRFLDDLYFFFRYVHYSIWCFVCLFSASVIVATYG